MLFFKDSKKYITFENKNIDKESENKEEQENEEIDEVPENMETNELFNLLATKYMPGPRARWYPSPWQRFCPVALYKGEFVYGKPEFSVGCVNYFFNLLLGQSFIFKCILLITIMYL